MNQNGQNNSKMPTIIAIIMIVIIAVSCATSDSGSSSSSKSWERDANDAGYYKKNGKWYYQGNGPY